MRVWTLLAVAGFVTLPLVWGCAGTPDDSAEDGEPAHRPHLSALSAYEANLGTLIEGYGQGFVHPDEGEAYVVFQGTFDAADGSAHPVDEEFEVRVTGDGTFLWENYGPYQVPFGPGDLAGAFHGTVAAKTVLEDGTTLEDPAPLDITFRVEPSILVREFQPTSASCGNPVKRALGGVPYRVRVQAVGFEPESFTYSLSVPGVERMQGTRIRHLASGATDAVGEETELRFPPVPSKMKHYGAKLTIQATSAAGDTYSSVFAIGVHRPIEVYYNGNIEIAETMDPKPVSACIPGGKIGRRVDYREQTTETRMRGYELNWNESWRSEHTVTDSTSQTVSKDKRNGVSFGVAQSDLVRWEVGGEASGSLGADGVASLGFKSHVDRATQRSEATKQEKEREQGLTRSETTTHTESQSEANEEQQGGGVQWQVSSSEAVARGFGGYVLPKSYGTFYRQTIRLLRRGLLVTYNQCGVAEVVGHVDFTDWTWAPDLALGNECPPFPETNLPGASCEIPPCMSDREKE